MANDDDDTLEADNNYLEIVGVGDEEKAVARRDKETSATSSNEENGPEVKDNDDAEKASDSQMTDESPVEQDESDRMPSGDPMIGALAGEIEAGLVDIIPPPSDLPEEGSVMDETPQTPGFASDEGEGVKSEISALADDIEAEVMKLVPVPEENEMNSSTPSNEKERSESPKSVIQQRDLDLLLHVD